jgi:signal transduction histidine kinase
MVGGEPPEGVDVTIEGMEGHHVAEVHPSPLAEDLSACYERAFEAGEPGSFEETVGDEVYRFHVVPVRDEEGEIFTAMGMSQDVTELKERERRLAESNARLEQFAYAASHDLQEPLRMVSTYLQLIEERYGDHLDEEGREFFAYAVDGAQRMREMIRSLLEYSRVTRQGQPLEPVEAEAVFEDACSDLRFQIEETDAEVTVSDLPRVRADPDQLAQVFRNLVSNALTYSGDEPPRVHVDAERVDGKWRFAVSDEGAGIPAEHTDRIFEVFRRLESGEESSGTGIGLAICQQIVDRHGGRMWVDSEVGEGSTFYFTIPAVEAETYPPAAPSSLAREPPRGVPWTAATSSPRRSTAPTPPGCSRCAAAT